jgi:sulfur-oxidizing protein SoxY
VRTAQGRWLVGQTWVNAAGGGCTVPGATRADGSWSQTLNQVQTRYFRNVLEGNGTRLRVRVMHPMDTGLVAGIPAFHIEELELRDSAQHLWWRLELHEPVSENPLITFELDRAPPGTMLLNGRDNNGNRIAHEVQA